MESSSTITCPCTVSARRRLTGYRRTFGDDALLLVPYEALRQDEQEHARDVAASYGAQLAYDAFDEFQRAGVSIMRPAGLLAYVIAPLCDGDPLDAMPKSYLHPYDEAYWRLAMTEPSFADPRAHAFVSAWAEATATLRRTNAKPPRARVTAGAHRAAAPRREHRVPSGL